MNKLNPKVIPDNKKFWSAVKHLFSDKSKAMNTTVLYKKGKIIQNYKKVSEVLNKYLRNLTKSLNLKNVHQEYIFLNASVKKINQSYSKEETFSSCEIRDILMRYLNENYQKRGSCLLSQTNNYLQQLHKRNGKFPDTLSEICRHYISFSKRRHN